MASRTVNTTRNIFWGAISTVVSIGLPFLTRSVIIYTLGVEYVGLGSLFTSILQVLSFTELGIGSALVYSMYEPVAHGNDEKVCALLNFYKKSYRVIGIVVLIAGLALAPFLDKLVEGDIPDSISLHFLFLIYLANNAVSYFVFAEKSSLLLACQRDDLSSRINLVVKSLLNLLQVVVILSFHNYYLFSLCIPACSIINNIITAWIAKKRYPQFYCKGSVDQQELQKIRKNVGGMVFQKIGNIVLSSVDTIVISVFLGLQTVGLFNNYYYIFTALNMFLGMICRALIPSVGNSIACNSKEKNYQDFQKILRLYEWIVVWWTACMLCLIQPFMKLWVGESMMLPDFMAVLFAAYFFIFKWLDVVYVYREASGIWWEGKWFPMLSAVINLTLNIVLVQVIGLAGILLSTILCIFFVHDTVGVVILKKYYFQETMNLKAFFKNQAFVLLSALLICAACYLLCSLFTFGNILTLAVRLVVCLVIPNVGLSLLWRKYGIRNDIAMLLNSLKAK